MELKIQCFKIHPQPFINFIFKAISPGLVENETIHSEVAHEPALSAKDVSAACLYAISVKDNVQVLNQKENNSKSLMIFFLKIDSIVMKPVGDYL